MSTNRYELGTIAASEAVLDDLYVSLRRAIGNWAAVTNQTPQAGMGYIGQHLTSVVTGYPGGRSGARGKDLLLPDERHAEIKTCSRVDQLGACRTCGHAVASIEVQCPSCEGTAIDRKDDSKWLIGAKSLTELAQHFEASYFFLVLFDFADFADPRQINARIWRVDPRSPGFAYCMVDYHFNIHAASASGAPFNLWPFSLKFGLLDGDLIYSARINEDDTIETFIFPEQRGSSEPIALDSMTTYARSRALTTDALSAAAEELEVAPRRGDRPSLLDALEGARDEGSFSERDLAHALARSIYLPRIRGHEASLPPELR